MHQLDFKFVDQNENFETTSTNISAKPAINQMHAHSIWCNEFEKQLILAKLVFKLYICMF